jgi:hypothetical protein
MIYRILCEGREDNPFFLDIWKKADVPNVGRRRLMGAYAAGAVGWGTLPRPPIGNRRARFYFTEAGWRKTGRAVVMDARRRGIMVRVVRLKNPPLSQVIYRDKWQVAILPAGAAKKKVKAKRSCSNSPVSKRSLFKVLLKKQNRKKKA